MCDKKFTVIGISDSREQFFPPCIAGIIKNCKVFSGGKRHHDIVAHLLPPDAVWIDVSVPLERVFERYAAYSRIVVFASGDPLFYGYAVTLGREFPDAEIEVFPSLNSLQLLAHRMLLPYSGMVNVSVTGRPWKELDVALIEGRGLIGVLTDRRKSPKEIAGRMLEFGYSNYIMTVGECLGNADERVVTMTLDEASHADFRFPNCVILQMTRPRERFFGIPENLFNHLEGRANMITKMPVRLLSLSLLGLYDKSVMWDVGFCTGSVSIEAKLQFPPLDIVAFERREESRKLLDENCRKFGAPGIDGVIADFMECDLSRYPAPDAVFIGGHGGRLEEMVERIFGSLMPGGVVVFNSVSAESCDSFKDAVGACGHKVVETHLLQIDSHNPIMVMKAI
jgi:precorrin-6y C5,15-methyltransferase (decarboxylating), cbiE subunit